MSPDLGLFEQHDLPNGETIYYRDKDHSYWTSIELRKEEYGGKGRLTGVSTVVGPMDFRPDNLLRWAAKSNGAGVAMLAAEGLSLDDAEDMRAALSWLQSPESIWQALVDNRATFEDIREEAANRGTNVHKDSLHAMALGQPIPDFSEMSDEEKGYSLGVVAFFHDHDPETHQAEQVVADTRLGVAGRFDLYCTPRSRCDDQLCPCHYLLPGGAVRIDAKTSGYISAKAHAQLGGYEDLAITSALGRSDAQWILQLTEDGRYKVILSHGTAHDFRAALDVYRRSGRISREANAARRAREAVPA